jgi:DNA-binding GntR family transcriptional regulator
MPRVHDPFGTALAALRAQLRNGVFAAGSPLVAAELAPALAVSITPVREALAHLAGEGLIEERRGRGYFAHRLEVAELEDLYRLHQVYIDAALDAQPEGFAPSPSVSDQAPALTGDWDPLRLRTATEHLFATIVRGGGNRPLTAAHRQAADRLAAPRLAEASVFEDLELELEGLAQAFGQGDFDAVRRLTRAYHRRRLASAKALSALLHDP